MGTEKLAGLHQRNGIYGVRFRIDKDLVDAAGRTHWQKSLKTKDFKEAVIRYVDAINAFDDDKARWAVKTKAIEAPATINEEDVRKHFDEFFRVNKASVQDVASHIYADLFGITLGGPTTFTVDNVLGQLHHLTLDDGAGFLGGSQLSLHRIRIELGVFDNPSEESEHIINRYVAKFAVEIFATYIRTHIAALANGLTDTVLSDKEFEERTLSEVIEEFNNNKRRRRKIKTTTEYNAISRILIATLGQNKIVSDITRKQCRAIATDLKQMPLNYANRKPVKEYAQKKRKTVENLTLAELLEIGATNELPTISESRTNTYISSMSAIFNYCLDEGYISRNPARGLTIIKPRRTNAKRGPFTTEQLQKLFTTPLYTGCRSTHHWKKAGNYLPRDSYRFWIPLIALYSGMRLNEICMLLTDDIKEKDGYTVIMLRLFDDEGEYRDDASLKTDQSERLIPVHPMLIKLGFMDLVAMRKRNGNRLLFPDIDESYDGYKSSVASKWYQRYLKHYDCRINQDGLKTVFHSYRHNFRDACRAASIDTTIAQALGGWEGKDDQAVSEGYGRGYPVKVLAENMAKIEYDVDLSHLYITP